MPARTLRLALAQLNTTVGDLAGNARLVLEAAREAAAQGAALIAAPELAITGYPPEDLLLRPAFVADAEGALQRLARDADGLPPLVVGALEQGAAPRLGSPVGALYNTAALLHEGRVVARYRKQRLPNYGVFDEQRYFVPGEDAPLFAVGGAVVGLTVCEDLWYADGPVGALCAAGAQLVVNINASPFWAGKTAERLGVAAERAREHGAAVAYVNQVGGQDELVFDGNSLVVDGRGELLARGACFEQELLLVDVPLPERRVAAAPLAVSAAPAAPPAPLPPRARVEPPGELDEIYRALVVGTRDYVRKSAFAEVIVSLSGGIDSALVAAIAVDALGAARVRGVALPSRYSSEGSLADARGLATRLGIELATLPIEPLHAAALEVLASELAGGEPGSTEENVQARIRGLLVMALSNKSGAMVLTTGNKSEYACGYATLYGDMAGGFAVIKDVPKTLVYRLARRRNEAGAAVIPESSIEKPPSAELRPDQLDSDSLPPYEVLDAILEAYVEQDRSLAEIVAAGHDEATARGVIGIVDRNEYKRRQAPPGVKITPRAFGRDRRLPLASRYVEGGAAPREGRG